MVPASIQVGFQLDQCTRSRPGDGPRSGDPAEKPWDLWILKVIFRKDSWIIWWFCDYDISWSFMGFIYIYIYIFMGFIYIHHGLGLCCGFLYPMMGHHDPWGYGLWDGYFLPVMLWDFWAPWCATKGSAAHIFEFWSTLTSKNWNVPYKTWGFDFCVSTMRSFGVKHLKSAKITKRHNYY